MANQIDQSASADSKRLADRAGIRRTLAARELVLQSCRLLDNQIRDLNARVDAAAEIHAETCGPAQRRLAEIEEKIGICLADRTAVPTEFETERIALLELISSANSGLEQESERVG